MSKQMKKYCIIGKLVSDTFFLIAFFGLPILASGIAEYLTRIILGG